MQSNAVRFSASELKWTYERLGTKSFCYAKPVPRWVFRRSAYFQVRLTVHWPTHPQSSGREFRHVFHVTIEEKLPNAN